MVQYITQDKLIYRAMTHTYSAKKKRFSGKCSVVECRALPGGDKLDEGFDLLILLCGDIHLVDQGGGEVGQGDDSCTQADAGRRGAGAQA